MSEAWTKLVHRLPDAFPFQLPLWLLTWWKHFGSGDLQVLAFEDGAKLRAMVPLFRHVWNARRQLTLIGSGISDQTDPATEVDVVADIEGYLASDPEWEAIDWQDLSADTPLRTLPNVIVRPDIPCSEIRLSGRFDDYWKARSADLRRNVRRYGERAREMGPVQFDVCTEAKRQLLDELIRLHELRWRKMGEPGMIAANNAHVFLLDVAEQFAAQDMLRLFTLRHCGEVAAVILAFLYRGRISAYMSAFDIEREKLGFGRILLYESIRCCFEQGYRAWNFLRGAEPYKASWGAEPIAKIRLYRER